ncbi:TolC family protein [Fodinibius halophilus]|uniref:TolC family protein n=1 Tax=Fodinibius halophilus TaxID=1736908 RepID=A0A6M1T4Z7_9BACT|nr:TolC family protein [Fodinibius halophilus]NGP89117.1 TolC family protein [Fodinibius halophilus]
MLNYFQSVCRVSQKAAVLVIISTVFIVSPLSAQIDKESSGSEVVGEQKKLELTEAIRMALANNSQIKRSIFSLKVADEEVTKAWSSVMPDVSGSASFTRNLEIPVNFVPAKFFDPNAPSDKLVPLQFGTDNNWQGGFSVKQTLFRGEAFVGISSSKLFKAAQSENLRATTQQIVTQTRLAYYSVLVAEEQLRLQEATVKRLKKNLEENKARQKAGLIDEYAVLQVEVQLRNQQPQLTQARYAVQKAYRELKVTLGIPLNIQFSVSGDLNSFDVTSQQAMKRVNKNLKQVDNMTPYQFQKNRELIDIATNLRGDIRMLEQQEKLKGREVLAIKSRFLPTLSASYNLNWTASQPGTPVFFGTDETRARSQTLGFTLSLPIFQGFERSSNLDIAQIERKDIKEQQRAAVRSAKNEIQSARESLNQALETAPARQQALELAQEGYQRAQARLENGMGSQLDVTNAELQLREAEANYAQMVYNYLSAKAQYDQAIGMVPFVDNDKPEINE